jgi:hypothetical protein
MESSLTFSRDAGEVSPAVTLVTRMSMSVMPMTAMPVARVSLPVETRMPVVLAVLEVRERTLTFMVTHRPGDFAPGFGASIGGGAMCCRTAAGSTVAGVHRMWTARTAMMAGLLV